MFDPMYHFQAPITPTPWPVKEAIMNECTARIGDLMCGKPYGHDGNHRDGVAEWTPWGTFVDEDEHRS